MTALLTDNLPLLAGAPNGIKKLRELILELAVRGKLVPQDASDEPASELLKRIAEEKARLLAEGKIKKQKLLADISEDEAPFKLPSGWQWVRLGEIAEIIRGVTYGKSDASDSPLPGYAPLLRGNNINRVLNFERPVFVPQKLIADHQYIQTGDIVIAMSSGSADLVGKAAQAETSFDGAFGAFCGVVRSHTSALFSFFGFFFQTPLYRVRAAGHGKGIGINNLQKTVLETLEVPLPPLAEQHRIVAKVDELMALCDRLEVQQADAESAHAQLVQALLGSLTQACDAPDFAASWQRLAEHFHTLFATETSIDALKQTLLQLAVMGKLVPQNPNDEPASKLLKCIAEEKSRMVAEGKIKKQKPLAEIDEKEKPYELPEHWEWARLGSLSSLENGDRSSNYPNKSQLVESGIPFINAGHLKNGLVDLQSMNFITRDCFDTLRAGKIQDEDILFCLRGSLGKSAIVRGVGEGAIASSLVIVRMTHSFSNQYLMCYFSSSLAFEMVKRFDNGTAQPNLSAADLNRFLVPLPPLAEQHRIVAKVDQLMALCDQLKTRLTQARQLNEQLASTLVEQAVA